MSRSEEVLEWAKREGKKAFTHREVLSALHIQKLGTTLSAMVRSGKLIHHMPMELIGKVTWYSIFGHFEVVEKS